MDVLVRIIRGTFRFIVSGLLWMTLGIGLAALAFSSQITDRDTVKSWPDRAGTYENFVDTFPGLIAEAGGEEGEESLAEMLDQSGLDQDALFESIGEVLPPEFLQAQGDKAIDAIFDFLEDDSPGLAP